MKRPPLMASIVATVSAMSTGLCSGSRMMPAHRAMSPDSAAMRARKGSVAGWE